MVSATCVTSALVWLQRLAIRSIMSFHLGGYTEHVNCQEIDSPTSSSSSKDHLSCHSAMFCTLDVKGQGTDFK